MFLKKNLFFFLLTFIILQLQKDFFYNTFKFILITNGLYIVFSAGTTV